VLNEQTEKIQKVDSNQRANDYILMLKEKAKPFR